MPRLRKIVLGLLWVVPFVYGIAAVSLPFAIYRLISEPAYGYQNMSESEYQVLLFLLRAVLILLGISPLALCITSAITLLQYHRRKPGTRIWAIACGAAFLASAIPLIAAAAVIIHYSGFGRSEAFVLVLPAAHLAAGILIISAFFPRNSVSELLSVETPPARVKGDGTSRISSILVVVFIVASLWFINFKISGWAEEQGLERASGFLGDQLSFFGALLIATIFHELGHIAAGLSFGMRLLSVRIGPFHVEIKEGKWKFVAPTSWKCLLQGGVRIIPPGPSEYRKSDAIWTAAGGPLASLITGGMTLLFLLTAKGSAYEPAWQLMGYVTSLSAVFFLANLIPVREAAAYSDGARIYQVVTGHVMEDYRRILATQEAGKIGPTRPRDYDIALIERTASNGDLAPHLVAYLHLVAADYYFDCGRFEDAIAELSKAEPLVAGMGELWKENCEAMVLRAVSFSQDREMAEKWWERGLNAKPFDRKEESEFGILAYCVIENRLKEAEDIWQRQMERTNRLPDNGERAFDLHYLDRLRKLMDNAPETAGGEDSMVNAVELTGLG